MRKLNKRHLKKIIREECGLSAAAPESLAPTQPPVEPELGSSISENILPEQEMMVEMAAAKKALEIVVESAGAAASLCANCAPELAVQAPVVEAMVTQAEALLEMLEAQAEVMAESTEAIVDDHVDVIVDMLAVENKRRRSRR